MATTRKFNSVTRTQLTHTNMAASKDFATSVVKSSEETFDTCCTPCNETGTTKEAKNFCVDCESHFCEDCLLHHNKFLSLRTHQIVDKSGNERGQQKEVETCLPTERCAIHHGKLIDMYCGNHDEVCCSACIAIKHRACVNVDYLPDIAKGTHDSAELKETLISVKDVLVNIKQERENMVGNLASLDQQKDHLLKEVEEYESELIQKIKELAEDAKYQISAKHEEYRKSVQTDVDKLGIVISTLATSVQKFSSKNEAQLFVNVKSGKKSVQDCKAMLRKISSGECKRELKLNPNVGFRDMITSLGSIFVAEKEIKEYKAILHGKFKVSPNYCEVTGACVMDDGTYLVSDFTNRQLKRLNPDFTVKDQIDIDGRPYSLQIVGPAEVAVFCTSLSQVHLVSVRDVMKLTATFNTGNTVSGGSYDTGENEMFLLKNGQMCICRKNGQIVRTYNNENIIQEYNEPKQTSLNNDNNTIFFANYHKGLLALTRDGKTLWSFKDPELSGAWGVCVLPGDIILVSGLHSNNILQVDKKGRKIGILLGPSENIDRPFALAFDKRSSRLIVEYSSNEIAIYSLSEVK